MTYKATKIELAPEGSEYRYIAKGDLTIKDVTKPVDLKFNYVDLYSMKMQVQMLIALSVLQKSTVLILVLAAQALPLVIW